MGQVPEKAHVLFLGNGRLAQHLSFYLRSLGHETTVSPGRATSLSQLKIATHIWGAVPDAALETVLDRAKRECADMGYDPRSKYWLHSSGAFELDDVISAHPLMMFPKNTFFDVDFYKTIPIVTTTASGVFAKGLRLGAILLPNPIFTISAKDKPLYHAYCVLLSNLPLLLWSRISEDCSRRWALPKQALVPILEKTLETFARQGASGLTGPWVRNDQATIGSNLRALPGELRPLYEAAAALYCHGLSGASPRDSSHSSERLPETEVP